MLAATLCHPVWLHLNLLRTVSTPWQAGILVSHRSHIPRYMAIMDTVQYSSKFPLIPKPHSPSVRFPLPSSLLNSIRSGLLSRAGGAPRPRTEFGHLKHIAPGTCWGNQGHAVAWPRVLCSCSSGGFGMRPLKRKIVCRFVFWVEGSGERTYQTSPLPTRQHWLLSPASLPGLLSRDQLGGRATTR